MSLTRTSCQEIEPLILVPVELLADEDRARVEAHLSACEACRDLAARARALDAPLKQLFSRPPPQDEFARLEVRSRAESQGMIPGRRQLPPRRPVKHPGRLVRLRRRLGEPWVLAPAAALAVVLLVALPLSRLNRAPLLEVSLLGTPARGTGSGASSGLPRLSSGSELRFRLEASRDAVAYPFRWSPSRGLEPLRIDDRVGHRLEAGVPLVLPPPPGRPLQVEGRGVQALVVVACARSLEAPVLRDLERTGRELRPPAGIPSDEDLEVIEALTGCRAVSAGYEATLPGLP